MFCYLTRFVAAATFLVFSGLIGEGIAQESFKTVEATGEASLSDEITPAEAKAVALNNARRHALEQAVGVLVHGTSTVYNFQLVNDMVVTATKGVIVNEKILENKCQAQNDQISCIARIEASVKPLGLERKGNLKVLKATVQRPDKDAAAKFPVFQNNDELQVRLASSEDAYVNLFSVDQYGGVAKLYPNDYCDQKRLTPDTAFQFPTAEQRSSGIKLRVHTPKGARRAVESILVILTKEKVRLLADDALQNPMISDLMRDISDLDPSNWAEGTIGYEVKE